ncbi:hypothetical protein JCM8202_003903 [Rhodotorula sphaerocarpa]
MAPVDLSQLRLNRVSCDPHELPSDPEDEDMDAYWDREADEIYIRPYRVDICGPRNEVVGNIRLFLIERDEMVDEAEHDFVAVLDDHSRELSDFASTLFSRKGKIKRDVVSRGRGVWGRELDRDSKVAYLDTIRIKKEHRSQGIGKWAINQLLRDCDVYLDNAQFLYALPASLWSDVPELDQRANQETPEQLDAASERVVSFFRKVGFRRLGTTPYFCCARSPSHLSHRLPVQMDADEVAEPDPFASLDPLVRRAMTILQRQNRDFF